MLRDVERGVRMEADHVLGDLPSRGGEAAGAHLLLRIAHAHLAAYEARGARAQATAAALAVQSNVSLDRITHRLTLRSGPQGRVSKGGIRHRCCPSFETPRYARLLRMRSALISRGPMA